MMTIEGLYVATGLGVPIRGDPYSPWMMRGLSYWAYMGVI